MQWKLMLICIIWDLRQNVCSATTFMLTNADCIVMSGSVMCTMSRLIRTNTSENEDERWEYRVTLESVWKNWLHRYRKTLYKSYLMYQGHSTYPSYVSRSFHITILCIKVMPTTHLMFRGHVNHPSHVSRSFHLTILCIKVIPTTHPWYSRNFVFLVFDQRNKIVVRLFVKMLVIVRLPSKIVRPTTKKVKNVSFWMPFC